MEINVEFEGLTALDEVGSDNSGVEFRKILSNYYYRTGRKRIERHKGRGFVPYQHH